MLKSGKASNKLIFMDNTLNTKPVFALNQNYPNPFTTNTDIRFVLCEDYDVQLAQYNSMGNKIKVLIDADAPAGEHTAKLNAEFSFKNFIKLFRCHS